MASEDSLANFEDIFPFVMPPDEMALETLDDFDLSELFKMISPQPLPNIHKQPLSYFTYAYESEIGKVESKIVKISLGFENFDSNTDYVVMCQLCKASADGKLSEHRIFEHGQTAAMEHSYKPLLKEIHRNVNELTLDFELYIVKTAKLRDVLSALVAKYTELSKFTNQRELTKTEMEAIKNRAKIENSKTVKQDIDELCFSFAVYEKCSGLQPMPLIAGPIYSNLILNELLVIRKICNATGSDDGGTTVALLLKYKIQSNIKIRFYTMKDTAWEAIVQLEDIIMCDSALTFAAPRYDGAWPDDGTTQINCSVQLVRLSDNAKSNNVRFVYMKNTPAPDANQLRCRTVDANRQNQPPAAAAVGSAGRHIQGSHVLVADSVESLKSSIKQRRPHISREPDLPEVGNTTYHNAIKTGDFLKIYKERNLSTCDKIREAINVHRENLLHYACKIGKSNFIRPLIHFRCSIIAPDINGQTPLHIAIEKRNYDCVDKFREFFENQVDYPHLTGELRRLLETYNAQGYTVLHLAVLSDLRELVDAMLKFSVAMEIDVCAIEALGSGDTILHLAKFKQMSVIINNNLPEAGRYKNYEGRSAVESNDLDDSDGSDDVFQRLAYGVTTSLNLNPVLLKPC